MGGPAKKLVTWKSWALIITTLVGWTAFRLYRDYQAARGFGTVNVVTTLVALCIGLIITVVVFRYANRPEPGDKS
jgi:hypothetical protein